MKKLLLLTLLLTIVVRTAFAEDIPALTGVVAASDVERITAPYAGEVISLLFREGDAVTAGMEAATMSPNIVRAPCSGTVTLFASQGDDAADVQHLYGALAVIEPEARYRVTASILTDSCLPHNQLVHPGETVYLCCTGDGAHSGKGIVTSASGDCFSVLVTEGDFLFGEGVDVCRRGDCVGDDCIGSGTLARIAPVPCTGEGLVVSEFVGSGMHVEAGDELYELAPTWDAHFVMHETSGVVAEVCVQEGDWVETGETLALVWPDEAMRVILHVPEALLADYALGRTVRLDFADGRECEGRVVWVSMIPDASTDTPLWETHIAFEADAATKFGMRVDVQPVHEETGSHLYAATK